MEVREGHSVVIQMFVVPVLSLFRSSIENLYFIISCSGFGLISSRSYQQLTTFLPNPVYCQYYMDHGEEIKLPEQDQAQVGSYILLAIVRLCPWLFVSQYCIPIG